VGPQKDVWVASDKMVVIERQSSYPKRRIIAKENDAPTELLLQPGGKMVHHSFDANVAAEYGIEEAILIHHFQYWIAFNRELKRNFIEERTWSFQTMEEIAAHFPYLNKKKIERTLNSLKELEILITGNHNKTKFDQTKWYAFKDEQKWVPFIDSSRKREMEKKESGNQNPEIGTPIPDTKQDSKQDLPPQVPKVEDTPPPTQEEEEELDKRLRERPANAPKIANTKKWKETVLADIRTEKKEKGSLQQAKEERIARHKEQAFMMNGRPSKNGKVVASRGLDYVDLVGISGITRVGYHVSDEEWKAKTGW
jgi:hypothetical protein